MNAVSNPLDARETWTVEPSATRDVVLVLDHFRPERHAVTQLYNKHFLGVVYIVDATGWPGCFGSPQVLDRLTGRVHSGFLARDCVRVALVGVREHISSGRDHAWRGSRYFSLSRTKAQKK